MHDLARAMAKSAGPVFLLHLSTPAYGAGKLFCMAKVLHYKSLDLDTHWVANQLRFAYDFQPSPLSVSHALPGTAC